MPKVSPAAQNAAGLLFLMKSVVAQPIAKAHQAVAQVGIFHRYIGVRDGKIIMTEVPEAPDSQFHQPAGQLLCALAGQTENGHLRLVGCTEILQLVDVMNGDAVQILAHQILLHVKHGQQMIPVGIGGQKTGDRPAKTAGADQNGGQLFAVAKQQAADLVQQHIHIIADSLLAKSTEAVEILAHLACGGAHHPGQFAGRNLHHAILLHLADIAVIFGQPLDHRQRNFSLSMIHKTITVF